MAKNLSWSAINDFNRCHRKFYLNKVKGIRLKEEFLPIALRQGKYFADLMSIGKSNVWFGDMELKSKMMVEMMVKVITEELDMLPLGLTWEREIVREIEFEIPIHLKGVLDAWINDLFVEMKYTTRLDYYMNEWIAHKQLMIYFYLAPVKTIKGYMCPVLVPQTRIGKNENEAEYVARTKLDVLKRPSHYFPEYRLSSGDGVKWGRCFYRTEFEDGFEELERELKWIRAEIRRCNDAGYWPQNLNGCLFPGQCEFLNICESGVVVSDTCMNINHAIYEIQNTPHPASGQS